jgi:hypothetical protein
VDLSINEGTLVVTGGPGDAPATAIVIRKTPKGLSAAGAEHVILSQRFGKHGEGWTLARQDLINRDGRILDTLHILLLPGGMERTLYFDVTDWLAAIQPGTGVHVL